VLAAYLFGWRGAGLAAVLVAILLGPAPAWLRLQNTEGPQAWAVRAVAFAGVGLTTGFLFDHSRRATAAWRATALRVTERERDGMIALARGAEAKDTDTGEHVHRVQATSRALARRAGFDPAAADDVGWAAMLHDVGKLHVPDRILLKAGPLSAAEWEIMRQHPLWGEQILARGEGFELARRIARSHHENVDGSGYPDGLRGDAIPLAARIVRIADAFDAMTNCRPYSAPRSFEDALEELDRWAGRQFDPELVQLMIELVRSDPTLRRELVRLRVAWRAQVPRAGGKRAAGSLESQSLRRAIHVIAAAISAISATTIQNAAALSLSQPVPRPLRDHERKWRFPESRGRRKHRAPWRAGSGGVRPVERGRAVAPRSNVQILHIALAVQFAVPESVRDVTTDHRPVAAKEIRHLLLRQPHGVVADNDLYLRTAYFLVDGDFATRFRHPLTHDISLRCA